jgi:hypothetical protein
MFNLEFCTVIVTSDTNQQPRRNNRHAIATTRLLGKIIVADMKPDIQNLKLKAQVALDELFKEHLIPFALTAYKVNSEGLGEFEVPFCDSRLHSVRFGWTKGAASFEEAVRAAVLERTSRFSGPLKGWKSSSLQATNNSLKLETC